VCFIVNDFRHRLKSPAKPLPHRVVENNLLRSHSDFCMRARPLTIPASAQKPASYFPPPNCCPRYGPMPIS